jgi:hypothetical protein
MMPMVARAVKAAGVDMHWCGVNASQLFRPYLPRIGVFVVRRAEAVTPLSRQPRPRA